MRKKVLRSKEPPILLDKQIRREGKRQKRFRTMRLIMIIALVLSLVVLFSNISSWWMNLLAFLFLCFLAVPFAIACLIQYLIAAYTSWKLGQVVKAEIVPSLLDDIFGEYTYDPKERIPDDLLHATCTFSEDDMVRCSGNDLIVSKYRGMDFTMCDIQTYSEQRVTEDDGDVHYEYTVRFQGRWMLIKTSLRPDSRVSVRERSAQTPSLYSDPVSTENDAFNQRFEIAGDPLDVFKLITPPMMEKLLEANRVDRGAVTHVKYLPDGTVGIALHTGHDSLETGQHAFSNVEEMKEHMRGELQLILDVVDALELRGE